MLVKRTEKPTSVRNKSKCKDKEGVDYGGDVGCVGSGDEVMGNEAGEVGRIQILECFETITRDLDLILDLMGSH